MPRPRRNRVGVTTTRTRLTATVSATVRNLLSPPPLPVLPKPSEDDAQNSTAQNDLPSDIYDVSDAEKERRKLRASAKKNAPVESTTTTTRRTRGSIKHTLEHHFDQIHALDTSRTERNDAMARFRDMTSTSKTGSDVEYSRRESVLAETATSHLDASGLDLGDVTLGSLDDSLGLGDDESTIELGEGMTRATDTSTFNIAGFKRRPRQSSVQGRGDAPIRPSSRGQATPSISTTISFGRFKRRQREPSILGTGRKRERRERSVSRGSQASRNREVLGRGGEDDDESGLEGEGTPVDRGKRRSTRGRPRGVESEGEVEMGSPVGNNLRKRKSLESHQDGREKRVAVDAEGEDMVVDGRGEDVDLNFDIDAELEPRVESPAQEEAENIHQSIELDDQPHISSPLSSPPILNDENDPDLAPPMSSGPASEAASPIAWPSLNTLAQKKYNTRTIPTKTPELDDDDVGSNISSPPSLTHSPNYRSAKAKPAVARKKAPPPPKSSADLASLLPRRKASSKNKNRKGSDAADPFDLDDGEASEEEAPPPARRAAAKKPFSKATSTANKGKQKADVFAADPKGERKKRVARTYGSRVHEQDRENDDNIDAEREESIVVGSGSNEPEEEEEELPEAETTVMLTERLGEELQKAVKKFKEVDQWELSFEEVSGSSSPMRDAR